MIRGLPLIFFALLIDGLQFMLSLGLLGASASVSWIPIFGQLALAAGFGFGIVVNITLSLGLGSALVMLTILMGYRPWRLFPAFLEIVPGFNMFPVWTAAAIWVVLRKEQKKGLALGGTLLRTFALLPAQSESAERIRRAAPVAAFGALADNEPRESQASLLEEPDKISQEKSRRQAPILPDRNFEGIRTTSDNNQEVQRFAA